MPFAYLKDPLFLVCFVVYWINRWVEAAGYSTELTESYLNDLICAPFWIPIMLWLLKVLRLRTHDRPPAGHEVLIPLLIWTAVFEVLLPVTPQWGIPAIADPVDVLCYFAGGFAATLFWTWRYTL